MTASITHLIGGKWWSGQGEHLCSLNPTRPNEVVAEGNSATGADVDDAVDAATEALTALSATPIHSRGAVGPGLDGGGG